MPAVTETYSLGVPVEVGKIDHELKKLWQESEGAVTRASLMNLAVYSAGVLLSCRTLFSQTWIRTCRCTFGGSTNSASRWTRNSGLGSIESSTTAGPGRIFRHKCVSWSPHKQKQNNASSFAT